MPSRPVRVLLVDDDIVDRKALIRLVREQGLPYEVTTAASVAAGRSQLRKGSFDVAVLDHQLGDGVGMDLLEDLDGTPAIIVTGCGSEEIAVAAIRHGAYDYLVKDPQSRYLTLLSATISNVLSRRDAEIVAARHAAELARSNAELERFASVVSHDLKSPLSTILGYAEILLSRPGQQPDDEAKDFLERIVGTTTRMSALIGDLLEYARVRTVKQQPTVVNVSALLAEVVQDTDGVVQASGGRIEAGELPEVYLDRSRLRQVLQNLLTNAVKFAGDEPPSVRVTCLDLGASWRVSVIDNGIGIAPHDQDRVFAAYERVRTAEPREGTGLGLATCQAIVEQFGGRIWLESEIGSGTSVHFTLPKASPGDRNEGEVRRCIPPEPAFEPDTEIRGSARGRG